DRLAVAQCRGLVSPRRDLDLIVKAQLVRGFKGSFWRTPGMETNEIQSVRLCDADNPAPTFHVGWWMSGLGGNATLERRADEDSTSVKRELSSLGGKVAETKGNTL